MDLWFFWWSMVESLRPAFKRQQTYFWFAAALAGMMIRQDRAGVTSSVRSLGLDERFYDRLLDFFHSEAVDRLALRRLWTKAMCKLGISHTFNGRIILLADGIKAPKEGKKMPAVKLLHQEAGSNSKPEYVMGHSCQAVALLCRACVSFFAVPLATEIHEGLVFSNRDRRTLIDKLNTLITSIGVTDPFYLVADAYYACAKICLSLNQNGNHLISRVRSNAVAFRPARGRRHPRPGRPKKYGARVSLKRLFAKEEKFTTSASPVAGEAGIMLRYFIADLMWKPVGNIVRFVLVIHPTHGKTIFISTDLSLSALQIIELYSLRFKIELSFKQAIHTIGAYGYHFWMKSMKPIRRGSGNQHLHRATEKYRRDVRRKMNAYHLYLQVGAIAQGVLQCLAATNSAMVWKSFRSWIRTIRPGIPPSEQVTALALSAKLDEFLANPGPAAKWAKFLAERSDLVRSRCPLAKTG